MRPTTAAADGADGGAAAFGHALDAALDAWRVARLRGIWLTVPAAQAALVPAALAAGFVYDRRH